MPTSYGQAMFDAIIDMIIAQTTRAEKRKAPSAIRFDDIVLTRTNKIKETLSNKAKEYASNENRFHNFDTAAKMNKTTPERELWNFMTKHLVSVQDMVKDPEKVTTAMVNEKIGDVINYLILLEGLFDRRMLQKHKATPKFCKGYKQDFAHCLIYRNNKCDKTCSLHIDFKVPERDNENP